MELFVNEIRFSTSCRALSETAGGVKRVLPLKKEDCVVDIFLKDKTDKVSGLMSLKRLDSGSDNFVFNPRQYGEPYEIPLLSAGDWDVPQDKVRKALYLYQLIQAARLSKGFSGDTMFSIFLDDLLTFVVFGEIAKPDTQQFNVLLNKRLLKEVYYLVLKYPEQWQKVEEFLEPLARDPKIDFNERQRAQWIMDVGEGLNVFQNRFPEHVQSETLGEAFLQMLLYLFVPGFTTEGFARDEKIQKAAITYSNMSSGDFYGVLAQACRVEIPEIPSIKQNLILLAGNNKMMGVLKRAQEERWTYLLTMAPPEMALREGILIKYGTSSEAQEVLNILTKHLNIVYEGEEHRPNFFLDMAPISEGLQKLVESAEDDSERKQKLLLFINEVVLGQMLAQGHNLELFVNGHFEERANFYSSLAVGTGRVAWSRLIAWVTDALKEEKMAEHSPHVLWNKSGFAADLVVGGGGAVAWALGSDDSLVPTVGVTAVGVGAGAVLGNVGCYAFNWSNRFYLCDIIGGVLGGLALGMTATFLNPTTTPITSPPLDPGHRFPVDEYGF